MTTRYKVTINQSAINAKAKRAKDQTIIALKQRMAQDINQYVPIQTGTLRNSVQRGVGSTDPKLTWDTPYAHFQWYGKVMIGVRSHSPWAHHGETKIYTNRNLTYAQGGRDWVNKAKKSKLGSWIRFAKSKYGGYFR